MTTVNRPDLRIVDDDRAPDAEPVEHPPAPVAAPAADPTTAPEPAPEPAPAATPAADVDDGPVLPDWLRSGPAFRAVAGIAWQRASYRTRKFLVQLPRIAAVLVTIWLPRGFWRLLRATARWVYDYDSAAVRHVHADNVETKEYVAAQRERRANLRARALVLTVLGLPVVFPLLAWTFPHVLAWLTAFVVFCWTVKLIPGKHPVEFVVALGIAAAVGFGLPSLLAKIPVPPGWVFVVLGLAVVSGLIANGRPVGKALVKPVHLADAGIPQKPTKEMVIDALCRIGLPGMTLQTAERVHAEIRVIAPGVATSAHGYTMEMELPPGITAEMVVGKRGPLAGALRRDLGCVWPSGSEDRHPGYLRLFLSHRPMNKGKQPPWPIAQGKPVDIFEPLPLFTDEELRWVALTLAGTHTAVGGASGFGKSVWLRQLSCALAFDLRVRLVIFDGKRSGDLDHVRKLAHAFHEGAEPEEIAATIDELRGLVGEYERRSKFLKNLPADERSPKVTSALASKYPRDLSPIVVIYDEVQEGTEYGVTTSREDKRIRAEIAGLLTKLSRVGRSAGIFLILASQKPDANVIPSSIMGNCSIRIAFKVSEQTHNDQILGTSARKNGIDATMFGARDRGMAWLKGGDATDAQVVRSWSEMVEIGLAVELADKAFELRAAGGWLTGQAAGEEPETDRVSLVDDARDVMDAQRADRLHLVALLAGLAELRPELYGHLDVEGLGTGLRDAGVGTGQVKVDGVNRQGVRRAALDAAGTVDEVDGEGARVVPMRVGDGGRR